MNLNEKYEFKIAECEVLKLILSKERDLLQDLVLDLYELVNKPFLENIYMYEEIEEKVRCKILKIEDIKEKLRTEYKTIII